MPLILYILLVTPWRVTSACLSGLLSSTLSSLPLPSSSFFICHQTGVLKNKYLKYITSRNKITYNVFSSKICNLNLKQTKQKRIIRHSIKLPCSLQKNVVRDKEKLRKYSRRLKGCNIDMNARFFRRKNIADYLEN